MEQTEELMMTTDVAVLGEQIKGLGQVVERIEELKKKAATCKIEDHNDKLGYASTHDTHTIIKNVRINFTKEADGLLLPLKQALDGGKEVVKKIVAELKEIEAPLADSKKEYNDKNKEIKEEAKLAKAKRLQERSMDIAKYGIENNGLDFVVGDQRISMIAIENIEEDKWLAFITPAKIKWEEVNAKLEEERKEKDAKEAEERKEFEEYQAKKKADEEAAAAESKKAAEAAPPVKEEATEPSGEIDEIDLMINFIKSIKDLKVPSGQTSKGKSTAKKLQKALTVFCDKRLAELEEFK